MLKIIKNFFNDNEKIIGLCAFQKKKAFNYNTDFFYYKDFTPKGFVPKVDNNILLI